MQLGIRCWVEQNAKVLVCFVVESLVNATLSDDPSTLGSLEFRISNCVRDLYAILELLKFGTFCNCLPVIGPS
jgi:hypothetical protein